jgi:hypothetical protein
MKKLILLLLTAYSLQPAAAQVKESLVTVNLSDVQAVAAHLVSATQTAPGTVQIKDSATARTEGKYVYIGSNVLYLAFHKGTGFYQFNQLSGDFNYLYAFWQKYIDTTADSTQISQAGHASIQQAKTSRGNMALSFAKSGSTWVIRGNIY